MSVAIQETLGPITADGSYAFSEGGGMVGHSYAIGFAGVFGGATATIEYEWEGSWYPYSDGAYTAADQDLMPALGALRVTVTNATAATNLSVHGTRIETTRAVSYRELPFKRVLHGVANLLGIDATSGRLTTAHAEALNTYINDAMRRAWRFAAWRELQELEWLTVRPGNLIPWSAGLTRQMGDIWRVSKRDPLRSDWAEEVNYRVFGQGILLQGSGLPAQVWVLYTPAAPEFTTVEWETGITYTAGESVYDPTSGNVYQALVDNTSQAVTNAGAWQPVSFPAFLLEPVKMGAFQLALTEEGQASSARLPAADMEDMLQTLWAQEELRNYGRAA
ncbi:MAG: hypothetical protein AAF555_05690 [Verrucomicrobiota bacterium]